MKSIKGNALDRVPPRATWPPLWLSDSTPVKTAAPPAADLLTVKPTPMPPPAQSIAVPIADDEFVIPIETVTPCSTCNSLELWWDVWGNVHCTYCQPPRHDGNRLMARAKRLRAIADRWKKTVPIVRESTES